MNRGGVGARSLNIELQKALNPVSEPKVERFGWTFAAGDKVMQIENDYDKEVYNGDIGYVTNVDPDEGALTASFDDRLVTYGFGELDTLVPAYAATIHKSQGSEYAAVVIPVLTQHYPMLQRNLLYTGVTRGKKLVVLVAQKKAVAIAVGKRIGAATLVEVEGMVITAYQLIRLDSPASPQPAGTMTPAGKPPRRSEKQLLGWRARQPPPRWSARQPPRILVPSSVARISQWSDAAPSSVVARPLHVAAM
jgi:hypothetical protein